MALRRRLLPPRHLLLLFITITLGLTTALVWFAWLLVRQDRDLEAQRARDRLEGAAARITAVLDRRLADLGAALVDATSGTPQDRAARLARWGDTLAQGAVLVDLGPASFRAYPAGRLLFDPSLPAAGISTDSAFTAGEWFEYRDSLPAAVRIYQELARSPGADRRAGALLRLGRTLRKAGQFGEASAAYDRLALHDSLILEGRPAGLVARHAKLDLLARLNGTPAATDAARALQADLSRGRWPITRSTFEFYSADLSDRLRTSRDTAAAMPAGRLLLSYAADSLWREGSVAGGAGNRLVSIDGVPVLVIWSRLEGAGAALLLAPEHVHLSWLPALEPILAREGVWLALTSPWGAPVASQLQPGVGPRLTRTTGESLLPWNLELLIRDPARLAGEVASRRRILLGGLAAALLLGLAGTYAVARAVSRELHLARVQSDFVSAVSHEFRTPLTSLRQLSELLAADRVPGEARRHAYYRAMQRESARLQRLVEGLLDFGRMEAGAHEFRFERLDATALVQDVVREFRTEPAGAACPFDVRLHEGECWIRGDRESLTRALWNLLDNAVKYAPEGAPVSVAVARQNGRVTVRVEDRGPGIPEDEQREVFEKFVRGKQASASGVRGTGLGLAMVREIIRGHGGEIRLESATGQGSAFTLFLRSEEGA
jgi:signal transduction histidine kinase